MSADRIDTTPAGQDASAVPTRAYIGFRPGALATDLEERAGDAMAATPPLVAKRDLERYYALLRQSLPAFSEEEASLIVDALNGTIVEPHTARLLWAEIEDAIGQDNLAEKWGVDGLALAQRLRALTPFEALAVADAAERFWRHPEIPTAENLRRVGLVRDERATTGRR